LFIGLVFSLFGGRWTFHLQFEFVLFFIAGQWEVGQMELQNDEFDILAVIKFLSWGLKDLLQQKEIAFNMDIDEIVSKLLASHFVLGDKQQIVQTLGKAFA